MEEENASKARPAKRNRIGNSEIILLIIFALVFDILSMIPVINFAIVIVGQVLMALFFSIHGVSVLSKRRAIPYAIAWVIEFIPAISIIPAITLETIVIIAMVKMEDKTGITVGKGGVKSATPSK